MIKKLVFSRHVIERMQQRGISETEIRETIEKPSSKILVREDNTQEFKRKVGSREYYVVVEHKKNALILVTAGCNNE